MEKWEVIVDNVLWALSELVRAQRGDHFLIKPRSLAKRAGLSTKSMVCSQVKYAVECLSKVFGMPVVWKKNRHGTYYKFHKYNELWDLLKEGRIEEIKKVAFSL